ncbi:alpha/beta fold hydrolase [candidate division KSB1 bacterium]|nr:alpha/beta fold hydrolase [candidate division KSB1 bacterium]RQW07117.1 MAG: alpha/beta fold hydrolase [candidate division KSB1 bacterium]
MKKTILYLLLLTLTVVSCTTITISEKDVFDVKRTIDESFIKEQGASVETVRIPTKDGLSLYGWWISKPDAIGTVLYYGGNGFVRVASQHIIQAFLRHPVNLLVFDYRGYGQNNGDPSVDGLRMDGSAAYHFLVQEKGVSPHQLVIHGHSLGSFIATYMASEYECAGLVLESPITTIQELTNMLVPWFVKPLVRFKIDDQLKKNNNVEWIADYRNPLLVIAGDADKVTPYAMAEKLYNSSSTSTDKLIIIKDGSHNDLPMHEEYFTEIGQFYHDVFINIASEKKDALF